MQIYRDVQLKQQRIPKEHSVMILVLSEPGHVGDAIREAALRLGLPVRSGSVADPDLFMHAVGCRAIVYAPQPRLLDVDTPPLPNEDRMRAVLRASHAPGIERVVVVLPPCPHPPVEDPWRQETMLLQKDGVGYTILRTRPLLDELADATNLHAARSIWLPRGKYVTLTTGDLLMQAIRDGIERDDLCGATMDVPSETFEVGDALKRAASLAGAAGVSVHVTSPSMSFAMRKLSLWMGLEPPQLESLFDRLDNLERPGQLAGSGEARDRRSPMRSNPTPTQTAMSATLNTGHP